MTSSARAVVLDHPAFEGLSPAGLRSAEAQGSTEHFGIGQSLCDSGVLPQRVLLILEGEARLLGKSGGRLVTLHKLGPGSFVGLASLLCAAPCEYVTASTDLTAVALSDRQILEFWRSEPSFRHWAETTLFPAEIAALLARLLAGSPRPAGDLLELLPEALRQARTVAATGGTPGPVESGHALYLASGNAEGLASGSPMAPDQPLPSAQPPLPLRLISLPADLCEAPASVASAASSEAEIQPPAAAAVRAQRTLATSLDLGQEDPSRSLRLVRAQGVLEETLACFQMLAQTLRMPFRRDSVDKVVRDALRRGQTPNLQLFGQLAASMGLHVAGAKVPAAMGTRLHTPALIPWKGGLALAVSSHSGGLRLASPRDGWLTLPPKQLEEHFPDGIELILCERSDTTPGQTFNFSWFLPALKRHRGVLIQVLVASFVVQLFTLANPLLIQVIIDKVIRQRSLDTLQVLGIGLVVLTLVEGVLTSLRTFLFTETTNRIDTRLGAEVIDHLLRLPLGYFDRRPVGELGTRIGELEKIRNFLTGQALTTVLDAAFSVIYIAVMLIYSWVLTIVALAVVPIQVAITLLGAPLFRRQFRQAAEANAATQSHLVEVLTGIQTVKAQNVEMVSRWKWQERYGTYISRSFEKMITGTALTQTSQVLQKISQLLVLWVGATLVLRGELTLGQLIAFRILSGYVTQPLLRLSTIWQNIQELKVSFERLADVVDTPEESDSADQAKIPLPPIEGAVRFDDVSFRFSVSAPEVLKNVRLEVPAGTFVGIVGQSGSGKSTLMKLLPRLYKPSQGKILIDGTDIDKVELYSLRRQIGIVPQDPLLFSGTVSENIALTDPDCSSETIVKAARIAAAHDFIMELPLGYSTNVGERGSTLSGGQRQRLAIARTLLSNPRLLVMDEATSALDYETERLVCDNLRESLQHCTVFFITHRLSTVRQADVIVMMHQGAIVESGTHDQLMALKGRYYALYRQQEAG
ncbi:peptidase domain-containing ABC transporter [Synechococcus sp. Cruz-9H2]|uniref:peptidase domain-containing ABC transporter n=1 Tax=unclassified Synechococcus TaxID=2626047 RepID=UPI0020CD87D2|nr:MULTISPECIES: peptidase domain-containing ABC transporter [unclassified Synechococcus]MCP9820915.1 peptidase domain-containing ABC transporter [Synechococcus sp. Cruz-9H2]MCP9845137.1 peptidase domain-containing ABC transporter [Synechococcus sp. Edmonson 11F2]MCP9857307.1 peptidase domain-containing ABC transporter [Synechococcus sp. Cruz-9C9]MCP9864566.1 peptidase domain-containing ABC transporter [Synechococcus sp. Cruz-7E5]MCP9871835.1 peptidase domain-containing ABC transporter [Synech